MRLFALSLILLLASCTTGNFESKLDRYFIWFTPVDTIEQATAKCEQLGVANGKIVCGCWKESAGINHVVSIKRWDVVIHELKHVVGHKHAEDAAYCYNERWFLNEF